MWKANREKAQLSQSSYLKCNGAAVLPFPLFHFCLIFSIFLFSGCAGSGSFVKNSDNICSIFREKTYWYDSAYSSSKRWGVPISVLMAIMHQESKFNAEARPPRTTCLFIFPGPRPSSAYGYAQALDGTWEKYIRTTNNWGADRNDFSDAIDFIGWYCNQSHVRCGIAGNDAYNMYLAYHEGHGGFLRKTYQKKAWLKKVAGKVRAKSRRYSGQLAVCEKEFRRKGCCLWPF
ncbi:MAG: transglycosylase SLT domain-containing protein [Deltaproteobacteria bacterium]|nr:transglycosylase SLT domain-containing protein [Deltaproteobacteria bacterium]